MAHIALALAVLAYGLGAAWLRRLQITGPALFLLLGLGFSLIEPSEAGEMRAALHILAEVALVIILFSDGTHVNLRALRAGWHWPFRLLVLGLPLSIALGGVVAFLLLRDWPIWQLVLLAALLAPTDAALGQAVVTDKRVPEKLREALSTESGLNDGIALPVALFLACLAVGGQHDFAETNWLIFAAKQVFYGAGLGVALGLACGWLLKVARAKNVASQASSVLVALGVAGLAFLGAEEIGGNGLIAAFTGGIAFGWAFPITGRFLGEFLEEEGQLLLLATFFMIGAELLPEALASVTLAEAAVALASLTVVRPAAVWLAMLGTGTRPRLKLFLGWFGPRGLATALFALIIGDLVSLSEGASILTITSITVLLSAILHGATAAPVAGRYGATLVESDARQS